MFSVILILYERVYENKICGFRFRQLTAYNANRISRRSFLVNI